LQNKIEGWKKNCQVSIIDIVLLSKHASWWK